MSDQADGLRQLFQARSGPTALAEPPPRRALARPAARSLVLTSGKGGVGTSNLALNLAIALGEAGQRVVLVDADLGLANIDLLCGLTPPSDLGDVLASDRPLAEVVVSGPGGIRIVPGAHGLRTLVEHLDEAPSRLAAELAELEDGADFVLVDAGSGLGPATIPLASAADQVVVITTPEPTSVADAHAAIQRLRKLADPPHLRAVVNQARSAAEAGDVLARLTASSREFLGTVVTPMGHVRADARVPRAVRGRRPFLVAFPRSAASRDVRRLARALIAERQPRTRGRQPRVWAALSPKWVLGRVAS
jgi:flagellar biosynthesis protein FlhG